MKRTLHILFLSGLFILLSLFSFAQPSAKKDKIEALKVAFITDKLALTPDEAKVFWPIYNQYQDELEALNKNRRAEKKVVAKGLDAMSDKEIEEYLEEMLAINQQKVDLQRKYNAKFKTVLSIKKVARLYAAEEGFKRELLKKIQANKK